MSARNDPTDEHHCCNPTMKDGIRHLPPEIVLQILFYLSFDDLLHFGATCHSNYEYHIVSLRRLRLGVFEKRVHSIISLLQAGWASPEHLGSALGQDEHDSSYRISVVHQQRKFKKQDSSYAHFRQLEGRRRISAPHDRPQSQEQMIRVQNKIFSKVLRRFGSSLRNLELMAYDLNMEGATALGSNCKHTLRHLALRFEHQHIRDGLMRPSTWLHPAPGNESWNMLIGIGRCKDIGLHNLETLIMERAGITPWQLMMLVKRNPGLTTLKLRTCRGARPEFLNWLGGIKNDFGEFETVIRGPAPGAKLEVLWLEHCHRLLPHAVGDHDDALNELCDSGLGWVRGLTQLQSLSFGESANIPPKLIEKANKTVWKIPEVILPYGQYEDKSTIVVDPRWK